MQNETIRFENIPMVITELLTEVRALREQFTQQIQHMTPKEPPVSRKVVMQRLGTTAPTLSKMVREKKIIELRIGRRAFYDFAGVVAAMKKPR